MQFQSFEEAKAFLQKTSPSSSLSLYDHLSDVIQRVLREPSDRVLDDIETISMLAKAERLRPQRLAEGFTFGSTPEIRQAVIKSSKETLAFFPAPSPPDAEPTEPSTAVISDVIGESSLLQWAGIALGDEQTYKLYLAIQRLSAQVPTATSIRFFGLFSTLKGTYFVCEVTTSELDEPAADAAETRAETHGQGANAFVYYVMASQSYGSWSKLPHVSPEQIRICRQKRRLLTGDLNASVGGYPYFRWNEAAYLRALIARISTATTIAPKGVFELKEEEEGSGAGPIVAPAEDVQMPANNELTSPDSWVHRYGALLKQGRIQPFVKEQSEEEQEAESDEAAKSEPAEEPEEAIPPLRSISEDESAPWSFRSYAGPQNPIVVVSSLIWPGALTIIKAKTFVNIYCGDGQRQLSRPWQPALPLAFQKEFKDDPEEPKLKFEVDPLPPPVTEPEPPAAEEQKPE